MTPPSDTTSSEQINIPEVLAEITALFEDYDKALFGGDPKKLSAFFWKSPLVLRFGVQENLYGFDEISNFRAAQAQGGGTPQRRIEKRVITTYGRNAATTNVEYTRLADGLRGRQSQTWIRMDQGWRIVAAHVSLLAG